MTERIYPSYASVEEQWEAIPCDFTLVESHDATVARARMAVGERVFTVNASAKKHPIDREDERIGELYAMGRALERMGQKMQKLANGYVREADNVRKDKANAKSNYGMNTWFPSVSAENPNPFTTTSELDKRYGPEDNPNKSIL